MSKLVAHSVRSYLFRTGSWIYAQISHLKNYRSLVITTRKQNLDIFPVQKIYSLSDLNRFNRFFQRQCAKVTGFYPFFHRVLRENQVSLLHSHFGNRGYFDCSLKKKLRIPQVTTFYGHDVSMLPQEERWQNRFKVLFEYCDVILAEGHYMKQSLLELGCPDTKVKVQHLGVNLDAVFGETCVLFLPALGP